MSFRKEIALIENVSIQTYPYNEANRGKDVQKRYV